MKIKRLRLAALAAVLSLITAAPVARAGTATLNGTGNWSNTSLWNSSPAGFAPNNGNNGELWSATVNGNTVTVDAAIDIQVLTFGGGTIGGTFGLTLNAGGNWTGGTMTEAGTTQMAVGSALGIGTGAAKTINSNRILVNAGTINWTSTDNLNITTGAQINTLAGGLFDIQTDADIAYNNAGAIPSVSNAGTFRKSLGAGTTIIGAVTGFDFTNTGTVEVTSGTLQFAGTFNNNGTLDANDKVVLLTGGGTSIGGFNADAGGLIHFNGGTHAIDAGASLTGAGTHRISAGVVNTAGALNPTHLEMIGGTLGGTTGTMTISGSLNWTGGELTGGGTTQVAGGVTATIGTGVVKTISSNRILANAGTINWTSTDNINITRGAQINTLAGGLFDIQTDAGIAYNNAGAIPSMSNAGTFRKSLGVGTTIIGAVTGFDFTNTGAVEVTSGTLQFASTFNNNGTLDANDKVVLLTGGGTSIGGFNADAGGLIHFNGGTHTINAGASLTGAGTHRISAGVVNTAGALSPAHIEMIGGTLGGTTGTMTISGSLNWTGGELTGGGTTQVAGGVTATIGTGAVKTISSNRILANAGTINWTSTDNINITRGAQINTLAGGLFDIQTDADIAYNNAGAIPSMNNAGTFRKSLGAGTTIIGAVTGFDFANTGAVEVTSGTLQFAGTVAQHAGNALTGGTWNVSNGATLDFSTGGNITTNQGHVTLDGVGSTFAKINNLVINQGSFTLRNNRDFSTQTVLVLSNSGALTVDGAPTLLTVNGYYQQDGGSTTLIGGATITATDFNFIGGTLAGNGTLNGNTVGGGIIAPGLSAGSLTVNGNLSLLGSSTLRFEIGGLVPGTGHDQIDVNGTVSLGGMVVSGNVIPGSTLDLVFIQGFESLVSSGSTFTILTADAPITDYFANVLNGGTLLASGGLGSFVVNYGPLSPFGADKIVLSGFIPFNVATPLEVWRLANFGSSANTGDGADLSDFDRDGIKNLIEYAFATNPTSGATGSLVFTGNTVNQHGQPVILPNGASFNAVFARRLDRVAAGLTYTVEFSAELTNWEPGAPIPAPTVIATDAEIDVVSIPFPALLISGLQPHFFRASVSITP